MNIEKRVIAAFSEEQASRLSGLSVGQLRGWARSGFYAPAIKHEGLDGERLLAYSFKDLVALRVLHVLRNQHGVSLPHLRQVSERLADMDQQADRWTKTKLWVVNRRVVWQAPGEEKSQEVVSQQYLVPLEIQRIVSETENDVKALLDRRDESSIGQIAKKRNVMANAAVVAGTRIPVATIKRYFEAGYSAEEIAAEYPQLDMRDIVAARDFKSVKAAS